MDAGQLHTMVENIKADVFGELDPSVVGGMFAGLDHDQIGGFDHETMEAALEAAAANLLGAWVISAQSPAPTLRSTSWSHWPISV